LLIFDRLRILYLLVAILSRLGVFAEIFTVYLQKLNLFNFKNIEETQLEFSGNTICLLGKNGSGKTSLLDAIYYLSFTKSAVNPADVQNIKQGQSQFILKGIVEKESRTHELICSYQSGQKKLIREDGQDCTKYSEHVGRYPVVLIAPQDIELIWDGSEMRRRFFDSLISQLDKAYLESLITYVNCLKQRSSLLRIFAESGKTDLDLLASYDQKMVPAGNYISGKRKQFSYGFIPIFKKYYRFLVEGSGEEVDIQYRSDLENFNFKELLNKNLQRDIILQRTSSGIHRDDFEFLINHQELKRIGSQGQQKSFLIALKLAEFESIAETKKLKPVLLLDDIFDKLDDFRIQRLMALVAQNTFGQLFITDARESRSREIFKEANITPQIFTVEKGIFNHG
jgi:DNA replication and repair protein RecF